MFESPEPLTELFRGLIPAARTAGYKLILTLLAREADSEEVFRDVERYWSSLHDLTGEHVLFVLGAYRAGKRFPHTGIPERREPVAHMNEHLAINGARGVYWPYSSPRWLRSLEQGHDTPSKELARSHTMEIAGLRAMFSLREDSIPALLLFMLDSNQSSMQPFILPLSILGQNTIYGFLKNLMNELEDQFIIIQGQRTILAELNQRLQILTDNERKWSDWYVNLATVSAVPRAREAADEILALCRLATKQYSDKRKCFDLLRTVANEIGSHAPLTSSLQSLIDRAFMSGSPAWIMHRDRKNELTAMLNDARKQENLAWQRIQAHLQQLQVEPSLPKITNADSGWDYFIAYSSKDQWYADRLFAELSKSGRAFLDRLCLRPGDVWPQRLRSEQDRARCTVVLLTKNIDKAWFAHSEYIHAIELARHGDHRVIPLLIGKDTNAPYGLEQIQAVRQDGGGDFTAAARQIAEALSS